MKGVLLLTFSDLGSVSAARCGLRQSTDAIVFDSMMWFIVNVLQQVNNNSASQTKQQCVS